MFKFIYIIFFLVTSLITFWEPFDKYLNDGKLLEITIEKKSLVNEELLSNNNLDNIIDNEIRSNSLIVIKFKNKGSVNILESDFTSKKPLKLILPNMVDNFLVETLTVEKLNSIVDKKDLKINNSEIVFRPFTLEDNQSFQISFISNINDISKISVDGYIIDHEPLSIGYKHTKLSEILNDDFVVIIILISFLSLISLILIVPMLYIEHAIKYSKRYKLLKMIEETDSKIIKYYLNEIIEGKYALNYFGKEYFHILNQHDSFRLIKSREDLKTIFKLHKYICDEIETKNYNDNDFLKKLKKESLLNEEDKILTLDSNLDKIIENYLDSNIFGKSKWLLKYIFDFSITKEEKDKMKNMNYVLFPSERVSKL